MSGMAEGAAKQARKLTTLTEELKATIASLKGLYGHSLTRVMGKTTTPGDKASDVQYTLCQSEELAKHLVEKYDTVIGSAWTEAGGQGDRTEWMVSLCKELSTVGGHRNKGTIETRLVRLAVRHVRNVLVFAYTKTKCL